MSMEEDLVRLVRETVKVEVENHMRNRSSELIGRGGDTVLGGMGNIYLQPGPNKKAYYKGNEIGTGSTGGTITGSGTTNYIPRFTGATAIGNSHLIDDGSTITSSEDIEMLAKKTVYYNGLKTGEIFSKKTAVETIDYYGLQITPYNTYGTNPGSLYIGDNYAAPAGIGIKITDTAISLIPVPGGQINVYGTVASQETEGTSLYRMKIYDSSTPPSVGKGGIYVDTDDNNAYLNKGTYASPNWQLFGVIDHGALTGLGDDDHTQYFLADGTRSLTGDLTIKEASPMLYFQDASANPLGSIGSLGGGFYIGNDVDAGSIYLRTGATPATRVQIYDTGVALGVPLVMGSNAITTNSTVDGVDVSAIPSTYLPLAGGTLTNDLTIKDASPMLYFINDSDAPLGSIGSLGGGFYIGNDVDAGSIYLRTGATPATRVQIYDTGVALGVPLAMSSNKITGLAAAAANGDALRYEQLVGIYLPLSGALGDVTTPNMGAKDIYFTDGYGIDLRNDNVHKISYASVSNSLQISTYDTCNFYFTRDSSTRLSVDYDGVRFAHAAFFRKNHAADNCYIVDDASGTMELHVPSGQMLKVVIG